MVHSDCGGHGGTAPSSWVSRYIAGVREGGRVLDVACGSGRHLKLALSLGLRAVGIDRDVSAAKSIGGEYLELHEANLEDGRADPLPRGPFDGVIVSNYLWRPILSAIVASVAVDGVLIYETFAVGNERFGRPKNPDFLLRPGELLDAVTGALVPIVFEHGVLRDPDRLVQRIVAVGPDHDWATLPPDLERA